VEKEATKGLSALISRKKEDLSVNEEFHILGAVQGQLIDTRGPVVDTEEDHLLIQITHYLDPLLMKDQGARVVTEAIGGR
jgi:hypothetical protein